MVHTGWWMAREAEPEARTQDAWLAEKARFRPPAFTGQKETGHVEGQLGAEGWKRYTFSPGAGKEQERAERRIWTTGRCWGPKSTSFSVSNKKVPSFGSHFHQ